MMKEIVIFDVDNTIVQGQSQGLFITFLRKKGYVSMYYYMRLMIWIIFYKLGFAKNPMPAMKYGLSFVKGKKVSEIEKLVDEFFNTVLVKKIYSEARDIIQEHQKIGRSVILVSNAPDILIEKIARYLHIEQYISTKLEQKDGIYTGNIIGDIMYGKQKLHAVNSYIQSKNLSLDNSWAYGDHESDTYVLSGVTHPYAVNPSRKLREIASKNNWPILTFKS